jgi:XapX domain-containing protein
MVNVEVSVLALLTGTLLGAVFAYIQVPIPAPPELPGLLGIVGIYVGYQLIQRAGVGYDLLGALGF